MSNYFFKRIKNLPTTANNSNSNASRLIQQPKTTVKPEAIITISDDELLDSTLQFEQTPQFKQAEEEAKKARGEHRLCFRNFTDQFIIHSCSSIHLEAQLPTASPRTFYKQINLPVTSVLTSLSTSRTSNIHLSLLLVLIQKYACRFDKH